MLTQYHTVVIADPIIGVKQAALIAGISHRTLARMAGRGEGPPRIRLSPKRIGYRLSAVETWVASRERAAASRLRSPQGG